MQTDVSTSQYGLRFAFLTQRLLEGGSVNLQNLIVFLNTANLRAAQFCGTWQTDAKINIKEQRPNITKTILQKKYKVKKLILIHTESIVIKLCGMVNWIWKKLRNIKINPYIY